MLNLSGWVGDPGIASDAARRALLDPDVAGASPALPSAVGANWGCCGPYLSQQGSISVVLRGEPLWRTDESAVLKAHDPADAVRQAYRLWGQGLLERLHGRFALAVIDHGANTALLAVDRMGIEPLAYASHAQALLFATSAERIARFPGVRTRIAPQALLSYIYFHMIPSPQTVFAGVHKLAPATAVEWRNNVVREFTYWKPNFVRTANGAESYPELKESLHSSLLAAVRSAQPDASTGSFLSGGLDSSTVAGFLARARPEPARTFSIGFGFADYDELHYARIANRRFGCDPREYVVTAEDISDLLPKVARAYDEPFGNASAIPTFCCARLATQHGVTHLLAGDGGDEIFAGNKRYAEQRVFERYQYVPAPLRSLLLEPVLGALPRPLQISMLRKGRNYIAQARTPLPDRFENWNFLHRLGFETVLHPDFLAAVNLQGPLEHMRSVYGSAPDAALVDRMLYYDWRFTLADNDLRKVGRMCELAGVRVSYPMLHQDVVDVSTRVPPDLKMQGTDLRTFYKRAMADFLPSEIINKSKHGFGLPFGLWLQQSPRLAQQIDSNLAGLRSRGIVRPDFIDRLRSLHGEEDARYYGVLVFTLSMLEQWFAEHGLSP
ncbi:MAG TPA: asparagine synthase-related protein [Steroidobacteraceae bacterium]|jgi:asparagine synthase (glutamine-hydrolysing)|nr:asparagine synthase-related protein [Steroidobacteraceae bacterium]